MRKINMIVNQIFDEEEKKQIVRNILETLTDCLNFQRQENNI